jgi:ribosomal protein S18 acetylase RimI-like enzyme
MAESFITGPAKEDELQRAFRMVFRHLPEEERELKAANALRLTRKGELDPQGVMVARSGRKLLGGLVCLPVAGASALFWPPQAVPGETQEPVENSLLSYGQEWVRRQGAKLAQTLLAPHEHALAAPLERNGFAHVTNLWYMRCQLNHVPEAPADQHALTYEAYTQCSQQLFLETLLRTYEESRDCPELTGVRSPLEILEGHQAQGDHDPARWLLARLHAKPVGVLMMTSIPEWHVLDISYVGVVREARRCGVGRQLVNQAILEARSAGAKQVTLAVDARNHAALDLYYQAGFEAFDQREVYLAFWTEARTAR